MKTQIQRLISVCVVLCLIVSLAPCGFALSALDFKTSVVNDAAPQTGAGPGGVYVSSSDGARSSYMEASSVAADIMGGQVSATGGDNQSVETKADLTFHNDLSVNAWTWDASSSAPAQPRPASNAADGTGIIISALSEKAGNASASVVTEGNIILNPLTSSSFSALYPDDMRWISTSTGIGIKADAVTRSDSGNLSGTSTVMVNDKNTAADVTVNLNSETIELNDVTAIGAMANAEANSNNTNASVFLNDIKISSITADYGKAKGVIANASATRNAAFSGIDVNNVYLTTRSIGDWYPEGTLTYGIEVNSVSLGGDASADVNVAGNVEIEATENSYYSSGITASADTINSDKSGKNAASKVTANGDITINMQNALDGGHADGIRADVNEVANDEDQINGNSNAEVDITVGGNVFVDVKGDKGDYTVNGLLLEIWSADPPSVVGSGANNGSSKGTILIKGDVTACSTSNYSSDTAYAANGISAYIDPPADTGEDYKTIADITVNGNVTAIAAGEDNTAFGVKAYSENESSGTAAIEIKVDGIVSAFSDEDAMQSIGMIGSASGNEKSTVKLRADGVNAVSDNPSETTFGVHLSADDGAAVHSMIGKEGISATADNTIGASISIGDIGGSGAVHLIVLGDEVDQKGGITANGDNSKGIRVRNDGGVATLEVINDVTARKTGLDVVGNGTTNILITDTLSAENPISNANNLNLTVWQIQRVGEDGKPIPYEKDDSIFSTVFDKSIHYIIKVEQPKVEGAKLSVTDENGKPLDAVVTSKALNDMITSEGIVIENEGTAKEGQKVYLVINSGFEIKTAYNQGKVISRDAEGKWYLEVPKGGAVLLSADVKKKQFYVEFLNRNNELLQGSNYDYNEIPVYNGQTPTLPSDVQFTYSFDKWEPAIVAVTEPATYTATYTENLRSYTVTFHSGDGVLDPSSNVKASDMYNYGSQIILPTASRSDGAPFIGWSDGQKQYKDGDAYTVGGEQVFTALWGNVPQPEPDPEPKPEPDPGPEPEPKPEPKPWPQPGPVSDVPAQPEPRQYVDNSQRKLQRLIVKGTDPDNRKLIRYVDEVLSPGFVSGNVLFVGTVDFEGYFDIAQETLLDVPVPINAVQKGSEYLVTFDGGTIQRITCEQDGILVVSIPRKASGIGFTVQAADAEEAEDPTSRIDRYITVEVEPTMPPKDGVAYRPGEVITLLVKATNHTGENLRELISLETLTGKNNFQLDFPAGSSIPHLRSYTVTTEDAERGFIRLEARASALSWTGTEYIAVPDVITLPTFPLD